MALHGIMDESGCCFADVLFPVSAVFQRAPTSIYGALIKVFLNPEHNSAYALEIKTENDCNYDGLNLFAFRWLYMDWRARVRFKAAQRRQKISFFEKTEVISSMIERWMYPKGRL